MSREPPSAAASDGGAVHLLKGLCFKASRRLSEGDKDYNDVGYEEGTLDHLFGGGHYRHSSDNAGCATPKLEDYGVADATIPSSISSPGGRQVKTLHSPSGKGHSWRWRSSLTCRTSQFLSSRTLASPFGFGRNFLLQRKKKISIGGLGQGLLEGVIEGASHILSWRGVLISRLVSCVHCVSCTICYLLGLGRNPRSCLPWRSLLWFYANYPRFESLSNEHHPCFFQACPILQSLGEPIYAWDAFQINVFVMSLGYFYAERHASITKDNHLLITHRLVAVPSAIQTQLYPLEQVSLTLLLISFLRKTVNSLLLMLHHKSGDSLLGNDTAQQHNEQLLTKRQPASWSPSCGDSTTRDTTAGGMDPLDTVSAFGAPSSVSPFDARAAASSFASSSSAASSVFSGSPTVRGRTPSGGALTTPPPTSVSPNRILAKPVVVLQHGLLESSINWIGSANVNDPMTFTRHSLPTAIVVHVMYEWRQLWKALMSMIRKREIPYYTPSTNTNSAPEGLERALPFHLLAKGLDVWLGNSRGNSFSRIEWNKRPYSSPMGWRRFCWDDLRSNTAVYGQDWTYNDMALYDLEAIQSTIASVTQVHPSLIRPVLVGFSQGAALVLLSTAYRISQKVAEATASTSYWNPCALVLISPPLITTPHYKSGGAPQKEAAGVPSIIQAPERSSKKGGLLRRVFCTEVLALIASKSVARVLDGTTLVRKLSTGSDGLLTPAFFTLARDYLGPLAIFIDCCATFIPTRVHHRLAQYVTFRGLQFYKVPLPNPVSAIMYANTPSGLTSQSNMRLWLGRVESGEPVDFQFFQRFNEIRHPETTTNSISTKDQRENDHGSVSAIEAASKSCKIQVWLGVQDNLCWPERCIRYIKDRCDNVTIWDTDYTKGKREVLVEQGRSSDAISVKLVQSKGHVDFVWCGDQQCVQDLASEIYAYAWAAADQRASD